MTYISYGYYESQVSSSNSAYHIITVRKYLLLSQLYGEEGETSSLQEKASDRTLITMAYASNWKELNLNSPFIPLDLPNDLRFANFPRNLGLLKTTNIFHILRALKMEQFQDRNIILRKFYVDNVFKFSHFIDDDMEAESV